MENYRNLVLFFILVWSSFLQPSNSESAKYQYRFQGSKFSRATALGTEIPAAAPQNHQWSTAYESGIEGQFRGAAAKFNIWQPYVELPSEFSLAQIWISAGHYEDNSLNTIEVGWQVYEGKYGDKHPHLFVYWTRDAYVSTGCYNLDKLPSCQPGFVALKSNWPVGGSLAPASVIDGDQYEIDVLVFWDDGTTASRILQDGNGTTAWWLQVNGEYVGYWPGSLFTLLNEGVATRVQWGGEVVNSETEGRHTKTDMGSGEFAEAGLQRAAYIRAMKTVNLQDDVVDAPLVPTDGPFATNSSCYDVQKFSDPSSDWGTYIFFGGAGLSSSCPI